LTGQVNAIQLRLLDLAKTAALDQSIGQDEVAQVLHALNIGEASATTCARF